MAEISYRRHRFPPVIIQHAVWLYLRFTLSYRDVEELLAERGLDNSYETVRRWVLKFGPVIARRLRQLRHRPNDRTAFIEHRRSGVEARPADIANETPRRCWSSPLSCRRSQHQRDCWAEGISDTKPGAAGICIEAAACRISSRALLSIAREVTV